MHPMLTLGRARDLPRALKILLLLALPACATPGASREAGAAPEPAGPSAAASADEAGARRAAEITLAYLGKRNFEVSACAVAEARVTAEVEARAGAPIGDRCTILVARRPDRTWLVTVRPATRAAPSRAGGSLAVVTVTAGGEGVTHIDYVR
jgi:hypothetical protein